MNMLIPPKRLIFIGGQCNLDKRIEVKGEKKLVEKNINILKKIEDNIDLEKNRAKEPVTIKLSLHTFYGKCKDYYNILITDKEIEIKSVEERGIFYGIQTLLHLVKQYGQCIPCLEIEDEPDFDNRGLLHDITRGKVPTLESLKKIVDKCAEYRINQIQLYVEHSYAFRTIPEFSEKFDTLKEEEIRELDNYCKEKYIELVPCLATFGHLYELLRLPRFEHLNELDIKASALPHDLWDRMAHYTIDPLSQESFSLISSMIEEYALLFSSRYFNLCCDETFDLGKGKNKEIAEKIGIGRLYVDFVNKLCKLVMDLGRIPMIWGDIVLKYPEIISDLPKETIFLNWNYAPDCKEESVKFFYEKGVSQYVCPGVWGWSRFTNDINKATENIMRQIKFGKSYNAQGVLITDWGDCGHVNFFTSSIHGIALGATLAWNSFYSLDNNEFDKMLSVDEWGKSAISLYSNLRELGRLCDYHFGNIYAWVKNKECLWYREKEVAKWDIEKLSQKHKGVNFICDYLRKIYSNIPLEKREDFEEILWGAKGVRWTIELLIVKIIVEYGQKGEPVIPLSQLIDETKILRDEFASLWMRKNKRSELENVTSVFDMVIEKLLSFLTLSNIS